jgi:hypothetical protein
MDITECWEQGLLVWSHCVSRCAVFVQAAYDNVLPPPEAKGSSHISFISDGFRLRRLYQFLTSAFCLKTIF